MARQKKDARYLNVYISNAIVDAVDEFSASTGLPKSRIVENAIAEYLQRHVEIINGKKHYSL